MDQEISKLFVRCFTVQLITVRKSFSKSTENSQNFDILFQCWLFCYTRNTHSHIWDRCFCGGCKRKECKQTWSWMLLRKWIVFQFQIAPHLFHILPLPVSNLNFFGKFYNSTRNSQLKMGFHRKRWQWNKNICSFSVFSTI